jgi:hypothetical protein
MPVLEKRPPDSESVEPTAGCCWQPATNAVKTRNYVSRPPKESDLLYLQLDKK